MMESQLLKLNWQLVLLTATFMVQIQASLALADPAAVSPREATEAIRPAEGEIIQLFNGKDLSGLTTWIKGVGRDDPDDVYSVVDGELRISGEGMGYVATVDSYQDYHLSLEYRWGDKTDGSGYVRNSGVLLNAVGPDGNANGVWMASIECQLAQGCEGDLIAIEGKDSHGKLIPVTFTSNTITASDGKTRWSPEGKETVYSGKQFWWSKHEAGFSELVDTRGKDDVASPVGEWTQVDCICRGDRITIKINGITVNECYNVSPQAGKILLENEDNEIFFRNIVLRALEPQ